MNKSGWTALNRPVSLTAGGRLSVNKELGFHENATSNATATMGYDDANTIMIANALEGDTVNSIDSANHLPNPLKDGEAFTLSGESTKSSNLPYCNSDSIETGNTSQVIPEAASLVVLDSEYDTDAAIAVLDSESDNDVAIIGLDSDRDIDIISVNTMSKREGESSSTKRKARLSPPSIKPTKLTTNSKSTKLNLVGISDSRRSNQTALTINSSSTLKLSATSPPSPPNFKRIYSDFSPQIIKNKLAIREFVLRFEKFCRLPARQYSIINDPSIDWNVWLYKSLIISFLRIISGDSIFVSDTARQLGYLNEIEGTSADSFKIWSLLVDYLNTVAGFDAEDLDFDTAKQLELDKTDLVIKLILVVNTTDTIRKDIIESIEQANSLRSLKTEELKKIRVGWDAQALKMNGQKLQLPLNQISEWKSRYSAAEKSALRKVAKVKANYDYKIAKLQSRTSPIGSDHLNNFYWRFLSKGDNDWGNWIICEKAPDLLNPANSNIEMDPDPINKNDSFYYLSGADDIHDLLVWIKALDPRLQDERSYDKTDVEAKEAMKFKVALETLQKELEELEQ